MTTSTFVTRAVAAGTGFGETPIRAAATATATATRGRFTSLPLGYLVVVERPLCLRGKHGAFSVRKGDGCPGNRGSFALGPRSSPPGGPGAAARASARGIDVLELRLEELRRGSASGLPRKGVTV